MKLFPLLIYQIPMKINFTQKSLFPQTPPHTAYSPHKLFSHKFRTGTFFGVFRQTFRFSPSNHVIRGGGGIWELGVGLRTLRKKFTLFSWIFHFFILFPISPSLFCFIFPFLWPIFPYSILPPPPQGWTYREKYIPLITNYNRVLKMFLLLQRITRERALR